MPDIVNIQDGIRVPRGFHGNGWAKDICQSFGIWLGLKLALPVRQGAVEVQSAFRVEIKQLAQLLIIRICESIAIAPSRSAHIAPFTAEQSPSTLSGADNAIEC